SEELQGDAIWPDDPAIAKIIDVVIRSLLVEKELNAAVDASSNLDADVFVAMLEQIHEKYPDECYDYASEVICKHNDPDLKLNGVQFLSDNYEIPPSDSIRFAMHLDPTALALLYDAEIAAFVHLEIAQNGSLYDLWQHIDEMPGCSSIEEIEIWEL